VQGRPDLELPTIQRRSLVKHPAFRISGNSRETHLEPDAVFVFRQQGNGMVCCFVELDTGSMNLTQMMQKYRRYEAWAQSETGQQYLVGLYSKYGAVEPRPTFRVLVIADDRTTGGGQSRMADLYRVALRIPGPMRDRLWFTTVAELRAHQTEPLPLAKSIWRRGRDSRSWENPSRLVAESASPGMGVLAPTRRQAVRQSLAALPLHPLFPLPPTMAS
jgi:hypothetical protein